ncbi:hypothetical protein HanIR_Chr10g0495271 [Helianthus annuus]|nr:hypothetical protein HanIR_Chr10g0495271 [Helianthus annuus]
MFEYEYRVLQRDEALCFFCASWRWCDGGGGAVVVAEVVRWCGVGGGCRERESF